jgi:hypothetical protein
LVKSPVAIAVGRTLGTKEKNINTLYLSLKFTDGDYLFGNDIKNFVTSAKKQGFKIYAVILQDPVFIFADFVV